MNRPLENRSKSKCPGCGLVMPIIEPSTYTGYYNCSAECWSVYCEILEFQFSNAVVFGQVHQMTVDSYALQHAGGPHPDKSVAIHLAGLHAAFVLEIPQTQIPRLLQRLADRIDEWPRFDPPRSCGPMTAFDVALASDAIEHITRVKKWASFVWSAWSVHHDSIANFVAPFVGRTSSYSTV